MRARIEPQTSPSQAWHANYFTNLVCKMFMISPRSQHFKKTFHQLNFPPSGWLRWLNHSILEWAMSPRKSHRRPNIPQRLIHNWYDTFSIIVIASCASKLWKFFQMTFPETPPGSSWWQNQPGSFAWSQNYSLVTVLALTWKFSLAVVPVSISVMFTALVLLHCVCCS